MIRTAFIAAAIGTSFALAACGPVTGKPASGISSSAPDAVESAAGGNTGGGANKFTPAEVTPGTPAGANKQP